MNPSQPRSVSTTAYLVLGLAGFISLFPIALMIVNALKTTLEINSSPLSFPLAAQWVNFSHAWQDAGFARALLNSVMVTALTILLVCLTGSMTAYVLARKKVRGWRGLSTYLLACTTLPAQLFLFPLYFIFSKLHLINNPLALAVIYAALYSPFAIFLMRTYFIGVPVEIEESAEMDGATPWQIFVRILLPIVRPGLLTLALLTGLFAWNEFLFASTFLQDKSFQTAIVAFFTLSGQYTSDWGEIMAGAIILVLPVVVLFLFLQRYFIEGMSSGSVKG